MSSEGWFSSRCSGGHFSFCFAECAQINLSGNGRGSWGWPGDEERFGKAAGSLLFPICSLQRLGSREAAFGAVASWLLQAEDTEGLFPVISVDGAQSQEGMRIREAK